MELKNDCFLSWHYTVVKSCSRKQQQQPSVSAWTSNLEPFNYCKPYTRTWCTWCLQDSHADPVKHWGAQALRASVGKSTWGGANTPQAAVPCPRVMMWVPEVPPGPHPLARQDTHMHMPVHTQMHAHACMHAHARMHTHTHARVHTNWLDTAWKYQACCLYLHIYAEWTGYLWETRESWNDMFE